MPAKKDTPLTTNLVYHAWNKDYTQVAVAPNSTEVWIYDTKKSEDPSTWTKIHTLTEHDGHVTAIDWCHTTDKIVTCGQDRNAYVWTFDASANKWQHSLVVLRINRAATQAKWSPAGNKFAVTSQSKSVPVCHFEEEGDWWIGQIIKKSKPSGDAKAKAKQIHKSSVTCVDWCPNNKFVVTGSTDFKCRIISAFMAKTDNAEDDGFGEVFPRQHEFGAVLATFDQAKAWINAVAWSPNSFRVAFAGHGSTVTFVHLAGAEPTATTFNYPGMPFLDLEFISDDAVLGVGFDRNPAVFKASSGDANATWALEEKLDKETKTEKATSSGRSAAFAMFQNMSSRAQTKSVKSNAFLTRHKNTITNVRVYGNDQRPATKVTTVGIDGRLLFWNVRA